MEKSYLVSENEHQRGIALITWQFTSSPLSFLASVPNIMSSSFANLLISRLHFKAQKLRIQVCFSILANSQVFLVYAILPAILHSLTQSKEAKNILASMATLIFLCHKIHTYMPTRIGSPPCFIFLSH